MLVHRRLCRSMTFPPAFRLLILRFRTAELPNEFFPCGKIIGRGCDRHAVSGRRQLPRPLQPIRKSRDRCLIKPFGNLGRSYRLSERELPPRKILQSHQRFLVIRHRLLIILPGSRFTPEQCPHIFDSTGAYLERLSGAFIRHLPPPYMIRHANCKPPRNCGTDNSEYHSACHSMSSLHHIGSLSAISLAPRIQDDKGRLSHPLTFSLSHRQIL
jgi:hypothetical protein